MYCHNKLTVMTCHDASTTYPFISTPCFSSYRIHSIKTTIRPQNFMGSVDTEHNISLMIPHRSLVSWPKFKSMCRNLDGLSIVVEMTTQLNFLTLQIL